VTNPLLSELQNLITQKGPIPFSEYMEMALYHEEHGFYSDTTRGPGYDYRTSPSLTPAFGRLIARGLLRMWRFLREPPEFTVLEVGAGQGDLAVAAVGAAPEMEGVLRWEFVERFGAFRKLHADRLAEVSTPVGWRTSLDEGRAIVGCVIANEVLDNFPVRVFEITDGAPKEVFVEIRDGHLIEVLRPPKPELSPGESDSAIAELDEGDRFELSPAITDWCRSAANALERGFLLVIDYGDKQPDLWRKRPSGSLVTYKRERLGSDPLDEPGTFDITAHVDFTRLSKLAAGAGFDRYALMTQREFLSTLNIDDERERLRKEQALAVSTDQHGEILRLIAERSRLDALAAPGGLGDHMAMVAAKRAPLGIWGPQTRRD
jgi:SAM-dependent MidA family methyltransferase